MSSEYYLFIDQQYGPYDLNSLQVHLKEGRFTKDSWVFCEGEIADWTRAEEVLSLKSLFQAHAGATGAPSTADSLVEKLKQASQAHSQQVDEPDSGFGTMLVSPSAAAGMRNLEPSLPSAPLSDIHRHPTQASSETSEPELSSSSDSWLEKFKNLFGRSKPGTK